MDTTPIPETISAVDEAALLEHYTGEACALIDTMEYALGAGSRDLNLVDSMDAIALKLMAQDMITFIVKVRECARLENEREQNQATLVKGLDDLAGFDFPSVEALREAEANGSVKIDKRTTEGRLLLGLPIWSRKPGGNQPAKSHA